MSRSVTPEDVVSRVKFRTTSLSINAVQTRGLHVQAMQFNAQVICHLSLTHRSMPA